ncbi:MAG: glycosyltransferase family A protein [Syntrophomonadaceae bacterium]
MNTPLVTVLMAVHNGEPYLKAAIKSILNQTYSNFEFIIIDDASSDASRLLFYILRHLYYCVTVA